MEIKVDTLLPCEFNAGTVVHAYGHANTIYISKELKDLIESTIEIVPITNKELSLEFKQLIKRYAEKPIILTEDDIHPEILKG